MLLAQRVERRLTSAPPACRSVILYGVVGVVRRQVNLIHAFAHKKEDNEAEAANQAECEMRDAKICNAEVLCPLTTGAVTSVSESLQGRSRRDAAEGGLWKNNIPASSLVLTFFFPLVATDDFHRGGVDRSCRPLIALLLPDVISPGASASPLLELRHATY